MLLVVATLLGACGSGTSGAEPRTLVSQGQRLFGKGIATNGEPVPRQNQAGNTIPGGMGGGMMHMTQAGCASCHGTDGHGAKTQVFVAPNITYRNLTNPAGMIEPDGSHGHHYTDILIRRAITTGVGADGDELDAWMPRWQLTGRDWQALLTYLKTLR